MAQTFPTTKNTFTTIPAGTTQDVAVGGRQHLDIHNDADAAIMAHEDKIGNGAANQTPSGGKSLEGLTDGTTQWLDKLTPNLLPNGEFLIDQQIGPYTSTGSRNNDGTLTLDGSVLLSDTNGIVNDAQELTDVPVGAQASNKLTVATANKKFGKLYYLTADQSASIIGGVASLSFAAHTTSAKVINNIRAAILSWSSTKDAFTRDVVSGTSWGSAGTNPTLATNWTAENTAANLALTTAYQTFKIENVAIDTASTKNVAVFIWSDDTDAAINDELFLADIKIEKGPVAHPIQRQTKTEARLKCFEQMFVINGGEDGNAGNGCIVTNGHFNATTQAQFFRTLPVRMLTVPALTKAGAFAAVNSSSASFTTSADAISAAPTSTPNVIRIVVTVSGATAGLPGYLAVNADTTARYIFDARPGV